MRSVTELMKLDVDKQVHIDPNPNLVNNKSTIIVLIY